MFKKLRLEDLRDGTIVDFRLKDREDNKVIYFNNMLIGLDTKLRNVGMYSKEWRNIGTIWRFEREDLFNHLPKEYKYFTSIHKILKNYKVDKIKILYQPKTLLTYTPKNFMTTLKKALKNFARPEMDRDFTEYNVIDDCGNLTIEGQEVLLMYLFEQHKKDMYETMLKPLKEADEKKKSHN